MLRSSQNRLLNRPFDWSVRVPTEPGRRRRAPEDAQHRGVCRRAVFLDGREDLAALHVDEPDVKGDFRLLDAAAPCSDQAANDAEDGAAHSAGVGLDARDGAGDEQVGSAHLTLRVLTLVRLFGGVRCYGLLPGGGSSSAR